MDDLISEFITEATESLEVLDSELVNLEQNPNDEKILGNIFRLVHTIKGTCGFLGLPRLESVAHAGENVLGKFRDGEVEVDAGAVSIILESLDCITMVVEHLAATGEEPDGDDSDLITRLNAYAEGNGGGATDGGESDTTEAKDDTPVAGSESGLSAEELKALEDAFNNAEFDGDLGEAPAEVAKEAAPVASVPEAVEKPKPKPTPAPKPEAKKQAVKKGLNANTASNNANQSIRVNIGVLEGLMSMVGELVLTRNQLGQMVRNSANEEFKAPLQRLSMITSELQDGVMKTRMQPIGNAWSKFPRLIRDLSIDLNKKIELNMEGAETELDRQMLEMIKDPLTHMVRNSCDHGLEMPDERLAVGKPEEGTIKLSAYHEGGHIIVEIADDGNGVNIERVTQKAIESGLATAEEMAEYSEHQIAQFIFKAGFSTAAEVTSVSGRGVGMDVVRTNIESIGGTVSLESVSGVGSTFFIKIPLTLAIVSVLVVETAGERFGVPQINVVELVRAGKGLEHQIEVINKASVLRLRDQLLPLISLADVLGLSEKRDEVKAKKLEEDDEAFGNADYEYIVVCRVGATDYGLIVDVVYDTEEIVVKPVSECLSSIPVYSGNTVLGDGSVIMILDPNGVAKTTAKELDASQEDDENKTKEEVKRTVSFLLFSIGDKAPKAVPLELLSRLEELDAATIEYSGGKPVVQYRGGLMRLTTLDDREMPSEGICEVVVFNYDGQSAGLIVDQILDITESELEIKSSSTDSNYIGSLVIDGKTTDVVDVGHLLSRVLDVAPELEELDGLEGVDIDEHKDSQILFVEDSMFFRNLTVPFLSAAGYKVTATPCAADALHLLSKNHYDLIVTDIEMPDMNGFELAKEVRETHSNPDIPIIAFTSTMNAEFDDKMHEAGINAGASKTEREKLILAIAKHLAKIDA